MCLTKDGDFKIAKEPIRCFKLMDDQDGNGKVNSTWHPNNGGYSVGDTINAATKLAVYRRSNAKRINKLKTLNGEVVHSYVKCPITHSFRDGLYVICEIPKGEYYWVSNYGNNRVDEYGSLSLTIKEVVTELWVITLFFIDGWSVWKTPASAYSLDEIVKWAREQSGSFRIQKVDTKTGIKSYVYEET
jgi:hypothetical protein